MTRHKTICFILALVMGFLSFLASQATAVATPTALELENAFPGLAFSRPTDITHAQDDRLFIARQIGIIEAIPLGSTTASTFLDIQDRVLDGAERGLLGVAFHPNYPETPYFYVNYTNLNGHTHVSRFTVSANPNLADSGSELVMLTVNQPFANHNGGDLSFGPDGYLYIALGDGGSSNDPLNSGQRLDTLLGKLLRIDVNGHGLPTDCDPSGQYTIPANNPFVGEAGACNEIWSYGLRNPWRFSFDRANGNLFIADVGQGAREEVNLQSAYSLGGENYGWCYYEGTLVNSSETCQAAPPAHHVFPIYEYTHDEGCSISGGYVYRGIQYPTLNGIYFYADYCNGNIWGLSQNGSTWNSTLLQNTGSNVTTFGEDACGNVYVNGGSTIYRLVDDATPLVFPELSIRKAGPLVAEPGVPFTYTLTVRNHSAVTATDLVITDTVPAGAAYVSGGTLVNGLVTWTAVQLEPCMSLTVEYAVTIEDMVVNHDYGVRIVGGPGFPGANQVVTFVDPEQQFLPILLRTTAP